MIMIDDEMMMEDLDYLEDEQLEVELANRGVLPDDDLTPMRKSED